MRDVIIRPATQADRDDVLRLHRALYIDHRQHVVERELLALSEYRDFDHVLEQDVDVLLHDDSRPVLLADRKGEIVGYITGHVAHDSRRVLSARGVIEDWYVAAELRGRGLGKRLADELTTRFVQRGCSAMESSTWPGNTQVRRAHERLGFREVLVTYRKRLG